MPIDFSVCPPLLPWRPLDDESGTRIALFGEFLCKTLYVHQKPWTPVLEFSTGKSHCPYKLGAKWIEWFPGRSGRLSKVGAGSFSRIEVFGRESLVLGHRCYRAYFLENLLLFLPMHSSGYLTDSGVSNTAAVVPPQGMLLGSRLTRYIEGLC